MNRQTVLLRVQDVSVLQNVLRAHELDLDCGGPRHLDDGGVGVVAFVTAEQLHVIRDVEGIAVTELDIPKARHGVQVGRGDRFRGGALHPSGIGRKGQRGMWHPSRVPLRSEEE
jgi:hypothetical protein